MNAGFVNLEVAVEEIKDRAHVAIVGGGAAGLAAAAILSRQGVHVTVFEKGATYGGRAATIVKDGFHMNFGPHALYRSGPAFKFFSEMGIIPSGNSPKFRKAVAINEGQLLEVPLSLTSLISTTLLDFAEKIELVSILSKIRGMKTDHLTDVSLQSWMDSTAKSARVRSVLAAIVRLSTYSNCPDALSAAAAIKQIALTTGGVIYVDQGWQTIINSLINLCTLGNITFIADTAVTGLAKTEHGVKLEYNNTNSNFDAALLAVPPKVAEDLLGGILPGAVSVQTVKARVACLDVCLSKLPHPETTFALGIDEPLYYSVHSVGGKLAPQGGALVHLASYLEPDETPEQSHEARLTQLLSQLQPGWEESLVSKRYLPNMVASYGIPLAAAGGNCGVASPDAFKLQDVFVCGDWVGANAFLLDAAISTAVSAAEMILASVQHRFAAAEASASAS